MSEFRTAAQLLDVLDPAWPEIMAMASRSAAPFDVVPAAEQVRRRAIEALQLSARSYLGALASQCGAIRIDHGWLRLLGAGALSLGSICDVTAQVAPAGAAHLVIALDVLGGRFAVNGGDLPAEPGEVCYWGPDRLGWLATALSHSAFVAWAFGAGLEDFYAALRWPDWRSEVGALAVDYGLCVYPFPFTREGRDLALYNDLAQGLPQ